MTSLKEDYTADGMWLRCRFKGCEAPAGHDGRHAYPKCGTCGTRMSRKVTPLKGGERVRDFFWCNHCDIGLAVTAFVGNA